MSDHWRHTQARRPTLSSLRGRWPHGKSNCPSGLRFRDRFRDRIRDRVKDRVRDRIRDRFRDRVRDIMVRVGDRDRELVRVRLRGRWLLGKSSSSRQSYVIPVLILSPIRDPTSSQP